MRVTLWIALILTTVMTVSGGVCESCCQMSACDPNPCKNNGICTPPENAYSCSCTPGYLGPNCDVNACLPNPCKNNGTCSPVDNGYICNCATGYLGENCDVNPCDIYNPCKNNGRCYPSEIGVNCSCPPGFIGESCQDSGDIQLVVVDERVCDVTECTTRGGKCYRERCLADSNNCGGKACNIHTEICIDDTCVDYANNCGLIDGIDNKCQALGGQCGVGKSCLGYDKCVDGTCRPTGSCDILPSGNCNFVGVPGTCSGGVCLVPCNEDKACGGYPCVGGYCAKVKCGESYCRLPSV